MKVLLNSFRLNLKKNCPVQCSKHYHIKVWAIASISVASLKLLLAEFKIGTMLGLKPFFFCL